MLPSLSYSTWAMWSLKLGWLNCKIRVELFLPIGRDVGIIDRLLPPAKRILRVTGDFCLEDWEKLAILGFHLYAVQGVSATAPKLV